MELATLIFQKLDSSLPLAHISIHNHLIQADILLSLVVKNDKVIAFFPEVHDSPFCSTLALMHLVVNIYAILNQMMQVFHLLDLPCM